jgi:prepilin signal peptidase PulO-like enzyme (type II secretory pathway)
MIFQKKIIILIFTVVLLTLLKYLLEKILPQGLSVLAKHAVNIALFTILYFIVTGKRKI